MEFKQYIGKNILAWLSYNENYESAYGGANKVCYVYPRILIRDTKYDMIDLLLPEKQYADEIISQFEAELPLDEMSTGPANELGNDEKFRDYGILSYVVQGLQLVPGKGERLICAALYSPVIGTRNIALNTIDKWRQADYQLSSPMVETLERLKEHEVHGPTRKRLEKF